MLSVWGMGFSETRNVPRDPETALRVVQWFQADAPPELRVTYMGGVPRAIACSCNSLADHL